MPTISSSLADFLYDVANFFVIAGAAAALLGALGTIWMGSIKERYSDQRMAANEAQTASANAQAAKAGEGAALANERAAGLEISAQNARLEQEQIRKDNLKLSISLEQERSARILIEERINSQGEQVQKLMPRRLSDAQKSTLNRLLSTMPSSISIAHDMAAADAKLLANEVTALFQSSGWQVSSSAVMGIGAPPLSGFALRVASVGSLTDLENHVKKALETAGVPFDLQPGRRLARPGIVPGSGFAGMPFEMFPEVEIILTTRLQ